MAKRAVKPSVRSRKRRRTHSLVGWLWTVAGCVLAISVWAAPSLQPMRASVENCPMEAQQEIRRLIAGNLEAGIGWNANLSELERSIAALPWVKSASARGHWSGRLTATIEPRVPYLSVQNDSRYLCIDQSRVAFLPPQARKNPRPMFDQSHRQLIVESKANIKEGQAIQGAATRFAFDFARALDGQNFPFPYSLTIRKGGNICLNIRAKAQDVGLTTRYEIGLPDKLSAKVEAVLKTLNGRPVSGGAVEYVNVSAPDKITVKMASEERSERNE